MLDTLQEIVKDYGVIIAFLGIIGIEVSPIKIHPIQWIGKKIFQSTNERLDKMDKRIDKLEKDSDFIDIMNVKTKLSDYKMKLQTTGLDENQYKRCFELIDRYEYYKLKYNKDGQEVVNGHLQAVEEYIKEQYKNGNILK